MDTTKALADVMAEREKQRAKWGNMHDDDHDDGALAHVAGALCLEDFGRAHSRWFPGSEVDSDWWGHLLVRKHAADRRKQLVIAGALIVAEIERLDRAE